MNDGFPVVSLTHNQIFAATLCEQCDERNRKTNRKRAEHLSAVFLCYAIIGKSNFLIRCDVARLNLFFNNVLQFIRRSQPDFDSLFFIIIVIESTANTNSIFRTTLWSKLTSSFSSLGFVSLVNLLIKLNRRVGRRNTTLRIPFLGECVSVCICVGSVCASTRKPICSLFVVDVDVVRLLQPVTCIRHCKHKLMEIKKK